MPVREVFQAEVPAAGPNIALIVHVYAAIRCDEDVGSDVKLPAIQQHWPLDVLLHSPFGARPA